MVAQAGILSDLPLSTLKIHQLQLIRGTRMAHEYEENPEGFHLFTKVDEYIESGMRTKEAIGLVAKEMACKKNELYEAYHKR